MASLRAELAEAKQRAREAGQLSLELARARAEAAAAAVRAGEGNAALADAQRVIEDLSARLRRHGRSNRLLGSNVAMSCNVHLLQFCLSA